MRRRLARTVAVLAAAVAPLAAAPPAVAQAADAPTAASPAAAAPAFDPALAARLGADEHGMRRYVFVVLKTGPRPVPAGPEREAVFKGHFANMKRLSDEGKLVLAGPFDGVDGWRGMFVFAVADLDEARRLVATDPVVASGEMVAEFHDLYGTAGLMLLNETHPRLARRGL